MRKLIAAINTTLDSICDHTAGIPDEELHQHYNQLLRSAETILYGRKTYELMEYWRTVVENPTGNQVMDEFAITIDSISKVVFSRTLKAVDWKTATLARRGLQEEVLKLRHQPGKDILVGSRSLIVECMNLNLVDEFQFCVHPVIARKGLPLFENVKNGIQFKLIKTKIFDSGAVTLYYEPAKE